METLRFTRALFSLAPSPFLLAGVVQQHLQHCQERFPAEVEDLIGGGETSAKVLKLKETSRTIFREAHFELYKWHSNDLNLEMVNSVAHDQEQSYAKDLLGAKSGETKLLGLLWNKKEDTVVVSAPKQQFEPMKRGVLATIAKIYDPLGLVSPIILIEKMIYRDMCDSCLPWDKQLPSNLLSRWLGWKKSLPNQVEFPRSLSQYKEEINAIDLHGFGDASGKGVAAAVYSVIRQTSGISQGLVAARSRLAK